MLLTPNAQLRTKNKGFSLVELLVVVTIIAILSVVAYTAVGGQTVKARNAKRQQDINNIQSALELHFIEHGVYPQIDGSTSSVNWGTSNDPNILSKKELSRLPQDPRKATNTAGVEAVRFYGYAIDGTAQSYQLGATLETETGLEAYVVGNNDTDIITGVTSGGVACSGSPASPVTNGSTSCLPYNFTVPTTP